MIHKKNSIQYLKRTLTIIVVLVLSSGFSFKRIDYRDGMHNNVCKTLKNNVLVYFIFVDTKETSPWTEFDIRSTLDSMHLAIRWIENQAQINNVDLNIRSDYFIGNEYTTIRKNLEHGTVEQTVKTPNTKKGLTSLNKWADGIAARVGKEVHITTKDGIPEIKNPRNKERLVAHLRDEHQTESVALLYLVNNYYRNDISITVNHLGNNDVEFGIASYKYPATLAQNILKLFGAANLYKSTYRRNDQKIKLAGEYFGDDIMQDVFALNIEQLKIGEYTQYLIGWKPELDQKYTPLLTDKVINY